MDWQPKFSAALYAHFGPRFVDGPSVDAIDNAFTSIDRIPDLSGVEVLSTTTVTPQNAPEIKKRLDDRGLSCSIVHHGEPYVRGEFSDGGLIAADLSVRRSALDMCYRSLEAARLLDAPGVYVFNPMDGVDYPFQRDFRRMREHLVEGLRAICEEAGELRVALEYRPNFPRGRATVASASQILDVIHEVDRPNLGVQLECSHALMAAENLGQVSWETTRRGLLYHIHLNDTQLPQDLSLIFGTVHFWECLEMMYWLREAEYSNYLGLDAVFTREDAVRSSTQFIRNVQFMLRVLDAMDYDALSRSMESGDILESQVIIWKAVRETR
jgi:xylose isomerase